GSQMHLANQVRYEYEALKLLFPSGRTPEPLYIDDTKSEFPYGFLVMSFLPGGALNYQEHLPNAAQCFADIHSLSISPESHLIKPRNPLGAVLDECCAMFQKYLDCGFADSKTKTTISALLESGPEIITNYRDSGIRTIINTEVNSGNFLVRPDGFTYLVDWEKPLFACPGQDLGHFLAPTTTLWKTETLLSEAEIRKFLGLYCAKSSKYSDPQMLWDDTSPYLRMNCLRGITWCAMAWVEYNSPGRLLKDEFTYEKIKYYLTSEFLEKLREDYLTG
ncbi:MAG: aminoglycoside phosphotransferase family protein, partial [Oscillospiraceae bacterium]|nr:aminoglycoside phosphotransferase family protein [Oscillospiraceae bacterium]